MEFANLNCCGFGGCVSVAGGKGFCDLGDPPKIGLLKRVMRIFSGFCCCSSSQKEEKKEFVCTQIEHGGYKERVDHSQVGNDQEHIYMVLPIVPFRRPDGTFGLLVLPMRKFDEDYKRERELLARTVTVWTV